MKRNNHNYSQLRYEQELQNKKLHPSEKTKFPKEPLTEETESSNGILFFLRRILFPNLTNLLLNNLLFFLTCLPVFLLIELALYTGGLIFIVGAWIFMPILSAGMSSLYHRAYEYTRRIAPSVRTSFISFFIHNLKQSAVIGLISGTLWLLCGIYLVGGPEHDLTSALIYYLLVIFLLFLVSSYTVMVMVQTSLFRLPAGAVLKNAVLLIPTCGVKGLLCALLQLAFIILLFSDLWLGLLLFFLGIPGIIITLITYLLWPRLNQILLKKE